jgi:hypothetical protein
LTNIEGAAMTRRDIVKAGGLAVGLASAILLLFVCFALPGVRSAPHAIPLGLAAPPPVAARIEQGLGAAQPEAFAITRYADPAAVRAAVVERAAYGGLAMGPDGTPTMYVASGAGPAVAQLLHQVTERLGEQLRATGADTGPPALQPSIVDLAPLTAEDPRGAGLAGAGFPLTIGAVLPAMVLFRSFRQRPMTQIVGTIIVAGLVGLGMAAILSGWFHSIPGQSSLWLVAGGLTLGVAATALALLGLGRIGGLPGVALGALAIVLVANPLSGLASAPELLPAGWGALGQLLPPGANATLLRSTAFFDGAGGGRPTLVLTAYLLGGLTLIAAGAVAGRRRRMAESGQ